MKPATVAMLFATVAVLTVACSREAEPEVEATAPEPETVILQSQSGYVHHVGYVSEIKVNGVLCIVVKNDVPALSCDWPRRGD